MLFLVNISLAFEGKSAWLVKDIEAGYIIPPKGLFEPGDSLPEVFTWRIVIGGTILKGDGRFVFIPFINEVPLYSKALPESEPESGVAFTLISPVGKPKGYSEDGNGFASTLKLVPSKFNISSVLLISKASSSGVIK